MHWNAGGEIQGKIGQQHIRMSHQDAHSTVKKGAFPLKCSGKWRYPKIPLNQIVIN